MSEKENNLTFERLRSALAYDPETGHFTWLVSSNRAAVIGARAGTINSLGYWIVGIDGKKYRQHRLAWFYTHGTWPAFVIDHIDCDRTNNRLANLRDIPQAVNLQNQRTATKASASGVLGVYWSDRWDGYMASIRLNGKSKRRGPYRTTERAYTSYLDLKRKHHIGCTL